MNGVMLITWPALVGWLVVSWWVWRFGIRRGRRGFGWTTLSFVFPVVALFWALVTPKENPPESVDDWLGAVATLKYKHAYNGHAIAIDPDNKKLHLKGFVDHRPVEKVYRFADIREFRFNISTGGNVIGNAGWAGVGHNIGTQMKNKTESGLFISVKDLDIPEWRIEFKYTPTMDTDLKRWMEILRQFVNEGAVPDAKGSQKAR